MLSKYRLIAPVMLIATGVFCQPVQSNTDDNPQTHDWSYTGDSGPEHWAEIDPGYAACTGNYQSPINIATELSQDQMCEFEFSYHPFYVDLINNGHTLIEKINEPKCLTFNGEQFSLIQFHFHTPSEHHIDDQSFDMEIHFVHENTSQDYLVLAVLFEESENESVFLNHFMNTIPTHVNEELHSSEQATPEEVMPEHPDRFYYYEGSLTTPPCTENVHWIVFEEAVEATKAQIQTIHAVIKDDNRPIQELGSRRVFHSIGIASDL